MSTLLTVVVPVYNEAEGLPEFHRRLTAVLEDLPCAWRLLYVNDGSRDSSLKIMEELRQADSRVGIVNLSRNFGKEAAMTAGLDHAEGDAVVVIDADLQDPPELIAELYEGWAEEGYDVVYARRRTRAGETWLKKTSARTFYWVLSMVSNVEIPSNTGDYRLMSRRAVEALLRLREQHRFMKGLFAWVGYPRKEVLFDRDPRYRGDSSWNYLKLWNFSLEGITGFSIAPLKAATYLGLMTALGALIYGVIIIYDALVNGVDVPGYPSLMVVILFLGGIQLVFLGVLGEYVGRIFNEAKQRPLYLVERFEEPSEGEGEGKDHD